MSAPERFLLPDLGEGLTDAELMRWLVKVGDTVALNQTLCEVETAKALVELPSPFAGTVAALLVEEGQTAQVGDALIEISAADREGILVGTGPLAHRPSRLRRPQSVVPAPAPSAAAPSAHRPDAKPAARKLARELGIDLTSLAGSGPAGVLTVEDVRGASPGEERQTRIPVRGVRRTMADAMTLSASTIPQATVFLTVDVTESMALLRELQGDNDYREVKLTPLTLAGYSLLAGLREHPALNASWSEQEIVVKRYVNLGIAVASPRGLIVPHIKDAHRLRLAELARAIGRLTDAARAGTTAPAELVGGTISITNVGVFGVDSGTPILNPGEAAILALGAVAKRPWVFRDELAVRDVVTLGLTFDHRIADGAEASRLLAAVAGGLANPLRLIG